MKSESDIRIKAIYQYFPVIPLIVLFDVVPAVQSVNELVKCEQDFVSVLHTKLSKVAWRS